VWRYYAPRAESVAICPQPKTRALRRIGVIVALLLLVLATLLAGPIGFAIMAVLLLLWALVTGTLHLVIELLLLPFRAIGALTRPR
jgi:hypothetical protein